MLVITLWRAARAIFADAQDLRRAAYRRYPFLDL
jgi:hypothetical protein